MSATAKRAFADLTPRGRIGRLRALAREALHAYPLDVRQVSFVSTGFNTVFRVDTAAGATYALRVSPQLRIHADGCEIAEAAWVAALGRDTGLAVPQVIAAKDGSVIVWTSDSDVPGPRSCVLFEWVDGRPLRDRMTVERVRKTGAFTARLHEHGATYSRRAASVPPAGVLGGDRVLSFRAELRLDDLRPAYGSVLAEAVERAQLVLDGLWRHPPHPPHVLHGDIGPGNVMVSRDRVVLIDFQDLLWGFEIQDVGIARQGIAHFNPSDEISRAFRRGYEEIRPWPEADPGTVDALRAARHLNVLNFGLNLRGPGLDASVTRHAGAVVEWMTAG